MWQSKVKISKVQVYKERINQRNAKYGQHFAWRQNCQWAATRHIYKENSVQQQQKKQNKTHIPY